MFFSGNFFAALFAVAAVSVTASPVDIERRALGNFKFCDLPYLNGACQTHAINNWDQQCKSFDQAVDSMNIDNGIACDLYQDGGCAPRQGTSQVSWGGGAYSGLYGYGFSAYKCYASIAISG